MQADKLPLAKFLDPAVPRLFARQPDPFPTFSLPYTSQKQEDTTKVPQT